MLAQTEFEGDMLQVHERGMAFKSGVFTKLAGNSSQSKNLGKKSSAEALFVFDWLQRSTRELPAAQSP